MRFLPRLPAVSPKNKMAQPHGRSLCQALGYNTCSCSPSHEARWRQTFQKRNRKSSPANTLRSRMDGNPFTRPWEPCFGSSGSPQLGADHIMPLRRNLWSSRQLSEPVGLSTGLLMAETELGDREMAPKTPNLRIRWKSTISRLLALVRRGGWLCCHVGGR
jgi:hypothetical protein